MTADTTTPLLALLLQGTGNNNNSWGQNLNDQVISRLDNIIAGVRTVAVNANPYTLSATDLGYNTIVLTGTIAADQVIVVPDLQRRMLFQNSLTGAFACILQTASGSTNRVNLPFNKHVDVVTRGNNLCYRMDYFSVGELFFHAGSTAPAGSMECLGTALKRASYPSLFSVIDTAYGFNDSTDFKLPNSYDTGRFLRSRTAAVAVATSQSNQNKSHTHTGSGTTSTQSANHTHTGSGTTSGISANHTHTGSGTTASENVGHTHDGSGTTGGQSVDHTHSGTTSGQSADHTHIGSGTTSGMSGSTTHSHALGGAQNAFITSVNNGGGASQGNLVCTSASVSAGLTTSQTDIAHTHTYSFTTSGFSADHTHTVTTGGASVGHTHTYSFTTTGASVGHTHTYSFTTAIQSADHTHTYSFTTAANSVDHTHTYSFTTSTGSADGTEARPEALVGILCIRY